MSQIVAEVSTCSTCTGCGSHVAPPCEFCRVLKQAFKEVCDAVGANEYVRAFTVVEAVNHSLSQQFRERAEDKPPFISALRSSVLDLEAEQRCHRALPAAWALLVFLDPTAANDPRAVHIDSIATFNDTLFIRSAKSVAERHPDTTHVPRSAAGWVNQALMYAKGAAQGLVHYCIPSPSPSRSTAIHASPDAPPAEEQQPQLQSTAIDVRSPLYLAAATMLPVLFLHRIRQLIRHLESMIVCINDVQDAVEHLDLFGTPDTYSDSSKESPLSRTTGMLHSAQDLLVHWSTIVGEEHCLDSVTPTAGSVLISYLQLGFEEAVLTLEQQVKIDRGIPFQLRSTAIARLHGGDEAIQDPPAALPNVDSLTSLNRHFGFKFEPLCQIIERLRQLD